MRTRICVTNLQPLRKRFRKSWTTKRPYGAPRKPTSEVIHLTMQHLEDEAHRPSHIAAQVPVTPACRFVGFLLGSRCCAGLGHPRQQHHCDSGVRFRSARKEERRRALIGTRTSGASKIQPIRRPSASPFNTCPMDLDDSLRQSIPW
jgi:hypothetical protein